MHNVICKRINVKQKGYLAGVSCTAWMMPFTRCDPVGKKEIQSLSSVLLKENVTFTVYSQALPVSGDLITINNVNEVLQC